MQKLHRICVHTFRGGEIIPPANQLRSWPSGLAADNGIWCSAHIARSIPARNHFFFFYTSCRCRRLQSIVSRETRATICACTCKYKYVPLSSRSVTKAKRCVVPVIHNHPLLQLLLCFYSVAILVMDATGQEHTPTHTTAASSWCVCSSTAFRLTRPKGKTYRKGPRDGTGRRYCTAVP